MTNCGVPGSSSVPELVLDGMAVDRTGSGVAGAAALLSAGSSTTRFCKGVSENVLVKPVKQ